MKKSKIPKIPGSDKVTKISDLKKLDKKTSKINRMSV